MLQQVGDRPAERCHQVGHRRDVDQSDVHRDTADAHVIGFGRPRLDDPPEQSLVGGLSRNTLSDGIFDDAGHVVQRGALGLLARWGHRVHRVGVHEGIRAVEDVEGTHQPSEGGPSAQPGPAHDANPIRCPSRRVRANNSTEPASPSSSSVASSAWSRLVR